MFGFRNLKIYQSFDSATYFFAYYDLRSLLLKWRRRRCWQNTALVFHTYFFAYPSSIVTPCWSVLEFKKKSSWKTQVPWTGFLAFKNQFGNWFLQATQAVKNPVWKRLKIQFVKLDFSKLIFQKSSTDQQGVSELVCFFVPNFDFLPPFNHCGSWYIERERKEAEPLQYDLLSAKFQFSFPLQPLWLVVHRKREKGGRAFTIWSAFAFSFHVLAGLWVSRTTTVLWKSSARKCVL